ncbi:MAG: putative glycoside hydrolase [Actinomyces sp.]|uniref:putative glycoside hydrolase n=1 Tax=Actinomyces sp. TaxID=29317 RepID=UPI0026DC897D|nr:putative glycoside hydrolase [Actinomyces sp.]MDO4244140.1 putative glycoside hydrolase [Actinomyces sp.]
MSVGQVRGAGAWIRYGAPVSLEELDFAAEHYRVAVLQPWETQAAAWLKSMRPDMTVLAYRCLSSVREGEPWRRRASGLGLREVRRRKWLARSADGSPIQWREDPGRLQARVWDPGYRRRWAEQVASDLAPTVFDGVMADGDVYAACHGLDLHGLDPRDETAPRDAEGLRRALDALVAEAGRELAACGRLLVPNIAQAYRQDGRWNLHASWGGGVDESWLGAGTGSDPDEDTALIQVRELAGPGLSIVRTPAAGAGRRFDGSAQGLYGLAAFWVFGAGPDHCREDHACPAALPVGAARRAYLSTGDKDYARTPWFPALDADLGAPVDMPRRCAGVWRREFEGGVAAVCLGSEGGDLVLPHGLRAPGPTGAPDGPVLAERLHLGARHGVLALRP